MAIASSEKCCPVLTSTLRQRELKGTGDTKPGWHGFVGYKARLASFKQKGPFSFKCLELFSELQSQLRLGYLQQGGKECCLEELLCSLWMWALPETQFPHLHDGITLPYPVGLM